MDVLLREALEREVERTVLKLLQLLLTLWQAAKFRTANCHSIGKFVTDVCVLEVQ